MKYEDFLSAKSQSCDMHGFEPTWMPDKLFDFQKHLVEWACRKGRAALFADCGLGKTAMQLTWAENVARKTNGRILLLTPLAVGAQTVREGEKFGVDCYQSRDGKLPDGRKIIVSNYEKLHLFNPQDFTGCVCDESSILKHFTGATQKNVTRFTSKMQHRLLCTATAAPNDYIELGTSSEALGEIGYSEMLTRFFRQMDNKGQEKEAMLQARHELQAQHFAKLAFRVSQTIGQYRLKHHAIVPFWKWVCSWAKACRKPSDLGFSDDGFDLPELIQRDHIIIPQEAPSGMLFTLPAIGLKEERDERRRTLKERCEFVANLARHDKSVVIWCHMNSEGDLLEDVVDGAKQVRGSTSDEEKEETYAAFQSGELRALVIKPKIGAWGLNWQHCNHVISFASHSYEQFYQSVRRCWRFGQKNPVTVDVIATEGERGAYRSMIRKQAQADQMFSLMVKHMNEAVAVERKETHTKKLEVPSWL